MTNWVGACLVVALLGFEESTALERFDFTEKHMGVPVQIVLYAADQNAANAAARAAYARILQLDKIMSDYDPESELMHLCRQSGSTKPIPVSDDLWTVLVRSKEVAQTTGGAFDVTVGPLVRLWRRSRREKQLPSPMLLSNALDASGHELLELDRQRRGVLLRKADMRIDLGGIGMGYAVDAAMQELRQHGIHRALIDASGDILAGDPPPGEPGWKIGIAPLKPDQPPSRYLNLAHAAVSTSGDAFQYVEIDGQRYSHIIDPKTGLGLTRSSSVTVMAPDCITADWLSTAVSVMGPERGMKLVDETAGCAALVILVEEDGEATRVYESKRLSELPWVVVKP